MRHLLVFLTAFFVSFSANAKPFSEMFPGVSYESEEVQAFLESLDYHQGEISLSEANVTLQVPSAFYYISGADAARVLTDMWGNPPSISLGVLGMIFPADYTPYDDTWGASIYFAEDGFVSDENAADLDYDELLEIMQADTEAANEERERLGYDPVTLVGWVEQPYYDSVGHKLHWAKEFVFGNEEPHTLNYDVRVLGRRGVLDISFISTVDRISEIRAAIPAVLDMPQFNEGARYTDFDPSVDQVAAYGIGGLIAGKVLAKTGVLAVLLAFLKKGWILIVVAVAAIGGVVKRAFGGGRGA